jgi:hypothetical protein
LGDCALRWPPQTPGHVCQCDPSEPLLSPLPAFGPA